MSTNPKTIAKKTIIPISQSSSFLQFHLSLVAMKSAIRPNKIDERNIPRPRLILTTVIFNNGEHHPSTHKPNHPAIQSSNPRHPVSKACSLDLGYALQFSGFIFTLSREAGALVDL